MARPYRWLERLTLGRALERTRATHLAGLLRARNALVLGDGDGRFLATLLAANPRLHATAVDSSRGMLALLGERCAFAADRLDLRHIEAEAYLSSSHSRAAAKFDLVVTHFFLDCFSEDQLAPLIGRIASCLKPGGLWVVSEFRIPLSGAMRLPARLLVRLLYLAFRLLTGLRVQYLPRYAPLLRRAGLEQVQQQQLLGGMLTAELWRLGPTRSRKFI